MWNWCGLFTHVPEGGLLVLGDMIAPGIMIAPVPMN